MKVTEKLNYVQNNHMGEWLKTYQATENELSDRQSMFCICGRLATGLHERNCRKFRNKVIGETLTKLKHLFPKRVATASTKQEEYTQDTELKTVNDRF